MRLFNDAEVDPSSDCCSQVATAEEQKKMKEKNSLKNKVQT